MQFADGFASLPGLISKIWLRNPETNIYGGVYAWRDRPAMEAFQKSDLFQMVATNPNFANITSRDFEVMEMPTWVTSGLAGARTWGETGHNFTGEGRSPFGRGLGVSPRYNLHPLPDQEGGRGMVEKGLSSTCWGVAGEYLEVM